MRGNVRLCAVLAAILAVLAATPAVAGNVGPMMIQNYGKDIDNIPLFLENLGLGPLATAQLNDGSGCSITNNILTCAGGAGGAVASVFGRTGAVTLQSSDVTGALGYTPLGPTGSGSGLSGLSWSQLGSTPTTLGGYASPMHCLSLGAHSLGR